MAKPFDPRKVLKQIANSLLREFFTRRGELADVPWDQLSEHRIEPVFTGWRALPEATQRDVQMIIRDVNELADHRGVAVLAEGICKSGFYCIERTVLGATCPSGSVDCINPVASLDRESPGFRPLSRNPCANQVTRKSGRVITLLPATCAMVVSKSCSDRAPAPDSSSSLCARVLQLHRRPSDPFAFRTEAATRDQWHYQGRETGRPSSSETEPLDPR